MNHNNPANKPSIDAHKTRRDFFSLLWQATLGTSSILGLAGIIRFLSHNPNPSTVTRFDLGPVEQFSTNSITIFQPGRAAIFRTSSGLEARSLICPHLGCQVELNATGFDCPCHGSRFSLDGSLSKGPANSDLKKLRIEISQEGHIILDVSET